MVDVPDVMRIPLWLRQLRRNVHLAPGQLLDLQRRRLAAVVRHAYERVPYYRHLLDRAGISPQDIRSPEDLSMLPVTTKATWREHPRHALIASGSDERNCISVATSGTTGTPVRVQFSRQEHWLRSLNTIRVYLETGYRLTDRQAVVSRRRDEDENRWWFQSLGVFRKEHICVFDDLDAQLARLRRSRPLHIHGYPSALKCLAQALLERGITEVRPRAVCTGAEVLDQETRAIIARGFDARVIDLYGTVEFGNIAWECPFGGGYHINSDLVLVEFLVDGRPARPGERAELVCTSLFGYTMPFIRYSLGDFAAPLAGTCVCGRTLPLMGQVEGRVGDLIILPSGREVSPVAIGAIIERISGIRRFQVVQEMSAHLVVRLVPDKEFGLETLEEVEARCGHVVAEEVRGTAVVTDSLPVEPSGKFRVVRSKIGQAF